MENQDGKRVARGPGMPRGGKIALAVVLVLVLALAGGYVGLCAYAGSSSFLPNTSIAGVDVSGQSREGAAAALEGALPGLLADSRAEFTCAGQSYAVNGDDPSVSVDAAAAVDAALTDQAGSFFTRGGRYLAAVMHGNRYSVPVTLTGTPDAVTRAVEECSDPEAQTTWEVTDTELVLHKGVTGRTIDVAALTDALAERLGHLVSNDEPASYAPIEAQVTTAPPAAPDFDAIRSEVAAEPADAYLDKETREIVPSVTGVDFDTAQAQAVLDAAGEGETVSVPLLLTEPKLTTAKLEANLFKDVLGSGSTTCAGPSNRWYNIDLAAKRLNGTILLPGETFSYNDTVGPYTLASGYKAAGTYQNGQSVDATAGGICQLSSNLYWVTLKANLEIVERHKHQFNGGYMPVIGTDATVWSDQLDFRFQNNTDYPIKIESYLDKNHKLHVTIYGTEQMQWYADYLEGKFDLTLWHSQFAFASPHCWFTPMDSMVPQTPSLPGIEGSDEFLATIKNLTNMVDEQEVRNTYTYLFNFDVGTVLDIPLTYQKDMIVYNTDKISGYTFTGTPYFFDILSLEPAE